MARHNQGQKGNRPPSTGNRFHDYVIKTARSLPLHECWVNEGWERSPMATVFVVRRQPSGKLIVALYHLDKRCLGVLRTTVVLGHPDLWDEFRTRKGEDDPFVRCEPDFAFSLVYGSFEYAADLGFQPNHEFQVTRYVLPAEEDFQRQPIEFGGVDGRPLYVPTPDADDHKIKKTLETLRKKVGEDGFDFVPHYVNTEYSRREMYDVAARSSDNILMKYVHPAVLMEEILPHALGEVLRDNTTDRISPESAERICEEVEKQTVEKVLLTKGERMSREALAELRRFAMTMVEAFNEKVAKK